MRSTGSIDYFAVAQTIYTESLNTPDYAQKLEKLIKSADSLFYLQNKTEQHLRFLINIIKDTGTCFYSMNLHQIACYYYQSALKHFDNIKSKNDDDIRLYCDLNTCLQDTYLHLTQTSLAVESFFNGLKMFIHINNKTDDEKNIGNPLQNFEKYLNYFESRTAGTFYLNSYRHQFFMEQLMQHSEQNLLDFFFNHNLHVAAQPSSAGYFSNSISHINESTVVNNESSTMEIDKQGQAATIQPRG